jgi:hypothetical protein
MPLLCLTPRENSRQVSGRIDTSSLVSSIFWWPVFLDHPISTAASVVSTCTWIMGFIRQIVTFLAVLLSPPDSWGQKMGILLSRETLNVLNCDPLELLTIWPHNWCQIFIPQIMKFAILVNWLPAHYKCLININIIFMKPVHQANSNEKIKWLFKIRSENTVDFLADLVWVDVFWLTLFAGTSVCFTFSKSSPESLGQF